jgi:hypothetical protein
MAFFAAVSAFMAFFATIVADVDRERNEKGRCTGKAWAAHGNSMATITE